MKRIHFLLIFMILTTFSFSQKFYLGNHLEPTPNEFDLLGISSKTGVLTYKYKKDIYDSFFSRNVGEIIVGVRNGLVVTTIYNMIPKSNDIGVPADILLTLKERYPFPFINVNGVYASNIDYETISILRDNNPLTFGNDRIVFISSVKQSILERTANK